MATTGVSGRLTVSLFLASLFTCACGHLVEITVGVFMETANYPGLEVLNASITEETRREVNFSLVYRLTPAISKGGLDTYSLMTTVCDTRDTSLFVSFLPCDANTPLSNMAHRSFLPVISWNVCEARDWPIAMTSLRSSFRSVVVDIVQKDKWRELVIICDNTTDMTVVQGILEDVGEDKVTLFQLEHDLVFAGPHEFWIRQTNYVVYCSKLTLITLLKKARLNRLDVLGPRYKWILLNPGNINFRDILPHLQEGDNVVVIKPYPTSMSKAIRAGTADLADVIASMDTDGYDVTTPWSCSDRAPSVYSQIFPERLKTMVAERNLTSTVYAVWTYSRRRHGDMGLRLVGNWSAPQGLEMWGPLYPQVQEGFNNRTFHVVTLEYAPFMMKGPDGRWTGLLVEFLDEIKYALNFSYVFKEAGDNKFGRDMGNGSFNGMVGVVQRKEADFALAPLTIVHDRAQVVDFTTPFWNDPYILLIRRPDPGESMIFICLGPFSAWLWAVIGISVIVVSVVLWISLHYYPGPRLLPKVPSVELFKTTTWQTFGALMQQGMVDLPVVSSSRLIVAMWWFYVIIIAGVYNGNLIAFLTAPKADLPVNSLAELAQSEMLFGTLRDAAFHGTLAAANTSVFSTLWNKVKNNVEGLFYDDSNVGLERVLVDKDYAYIIEASFYTMLHVKNGSLKDKQCEFARPKEDFLVNMYGLAFQKNSPYTDIFSMQILRILESGFLERIKHKWMSTANRCTGLERVSEQTNIGLLEAQGAFYILCIGVVAATLVICAEYISVRCKSQCFSDLPCSHIGNCDTTKDYNVGLHVGSICPPTTRDGEHHSESPIRNGVIPSHSEPASEYASDEESGVVVRENGSAFDSLDSLSYVDIFTGRVTAADTLENYGEFDTDITSLRKRTSYPLQNGVSRESSQKHPHNERRVRSISESIHMESLYDSESMESIRGHSPDRISSFL